MSRPLRFLHVTTFYPPYSFGGDGLYVYRLAHELGKLGHFVDVVHCVDSFRLFDSREPSTALPDHPQVTVHQLRSGWGPLSPFLSHQTGKPFLKTHAIKALLTKPVDVIHFHNVSLLGPGVLAIGDSTRPTIKLYTAHEHWLVCPMNVLWKFNREPCDRPTCTRCTLAAGRPPQLWRHTNLLADATGNVDVFLAPSRFTIRMHAERGFNRPFTHLPPFSTRSDDEWRNPGPRPHERPYFVFVGRLEPVKGLETLIRVWDRIEGADLLIVGDGSERPIVERAAARNPRIVFRGPIPPSDLGPYFTHSQACLVPSVTYEVAPTVVLEAFARRAPVIARDLGGIPEFVQDSGGGLLFKTDDDLLAAIERVRRDRPLRDELAKRGYAAFAAHWTETAHLAAYLTVINDVAQRKFGQLPWASET